MNLGKNHEQRIETRVFRGSRRWGACLNEISMTLTRYTKLESLSN